MKTENNASMPLKSRAQTAYRGENFHRVSQLGENTYHKENESAQERKQPALQFFTVDAQCSRTYTSLFCCFPSLSLSGEKHKNILSSEHQDI